MREGMLQGVLPVVGAFQPRGEHLFLGLPHIICCGISLPSYQVLELAPSSKEPVPHDGLDLVFFSSSNQLRWWAAIVGTVLHSFTIRSQQRGMEDVMNGPGRGKIKLVGHRGYLFGDEKGSMTFGGQFAR